MAPNRDGHANHGHACVKGRFAYGYATHPDRITKPMIRARITDPWREVELGRGHRRTPRASSAASRRSTAGTRSAASRPRAARTRRRSSSRSWCAPRFGNNNVDTCARVCHSPTGYGLKNTLGESAGTQAFDSVHEGGRHHRRRREPDRRPSGVRLAAEAPPAPGREAHRHRSARDRPRAHAAHRGGLPPAAAARHERRADQRARARRRHRGARRRTTTSPSAARSTPTASGRRSSPSRAIRRRRPRRSPACPPRLVRGAARLYAAGRQRRHLLRPRRHRAQPGHDDGHGHREPRDGHRQPRPRGRRRQPAARPEQRAGLVRHGLVPARVQRLPPRVGRRSRAACSSRPGACRSSAEPGLRIPNMFEAALDGSFKGTVHPGRGLRAVRPEHAARHRRALPRWNASSCRTCS